MSIWSRILRFFSSSFRHQTASRILVLTLWVDFARADSPTPRPPVEQNVEEIRALVIKAAAENIARLKQCKLTWTRTTLSDGFVAGNQQNGTTRGSYELWKDGVRVATNADTEGWVSFPNKPPNIRQFKYRTTFDGSELREFDPGPPKSRMWITDRERYRHNANYFEVIRWHLPTDVRMYHETPPTEPLTWSCALIEVDSERVYRFTLSNANATITADYNADRGLQFQAREWRRPDGTVSLHGKLTLEKVDADFWFPTSLKSESFETSGKVVLRNEYILDKNASTFNQPIPDESFDLPIAPNMWIGDGRGWFRAEYSGRTAPASIFERMWIVTSKGASKFFNGVRGRNAKTCLGIVLIGLVGFLCFRIGRFVGLRQSQPKVDSIPQSKRSEVDDRRSTTP